MSPLAWYALICAFLIWLFFVALELLRMALGKLIHGAANGFEKACRRFTKWAVRTHHRLSGYGQPHAIPSPRGAKKRRPFRYKPLL